MLPFAGASVSKEIVEDERSPVRRSLCVYFTLRRLLWLGLFEHGPVAQQRVTRRAPSMAAAPAAPKKGASILSTSSPRPGEPISRWRYHHLGNNGEQRRCASVGRVCTLTGRLEQARARDAQSIKEAIAGAGLIVTADRLGAK